MIRITHFRKKCIGCNACVEANAERWRMSRKDGKSTLVSGKEKKGGHYDYIGNDVEYEENKIAAKNCPVKIIKVEKIRKRIVR